MIIRDPHNENFTAINNAILRDSSLSDGAVRLLVYMLSMSNDWNFNIRQMAKFFGVSVSTISNRINELKQAGYIRTEKITDGKGRFTSCVWFVYENPCSNLSEHGENRTRFEPNTDLTEHGKTEDIRNNINEEKPLIKEISSIKEKAGGFDSIFEEFPLFASDPELKSVFEEFIKMRKKIKAPLTENALKLAINKAIDLSGGDPEEIKKIVNQSILNSWRGLFPEKSTKAIIENPFTKLKSEEGFI